MSPPICQVDDLSITFHRGNASFKAVDSLSFEVPWARAYGIVGESGSGKSTVLNAISGRLDKWSGSIRIDGNAVGRHRPRSLYRSVQMVFQDPYSSLHPRHTIERALLEPVRFHRLPDPQRRITEALETVGLGDTYRFRFPHQLSGGQRQRVAIARALILEPDLVLLDEPTSALDVSVQAEILNMLKEIQTQRQLTYILVSHNLAVVAFLCGEVAVMRKGRFVDRLTTRQLVDGDTNVAYTRTLLEASEGYRRIGYT